jgi:recombination associated protein RdgC
MTAWLQGEAPPGFALDADCELKAPGEGGAVVRCSRQDLTASEVRAHLDSGKQVSKLGLIWQERIRFVLTEDLGVRRVQFLDLLQEEAEQAGDDAESLFEATFALMTGELAVLIADLIDALGGEPQDQDA